MVCWMAEVDLLDAGPSVWGFVSSLQICMEDTVFFRSNLLVLLEEQRLRRLGKQFHVAAGRTGSNRVDRTHSGRRSDRGGGWKVRPSALFFGALTDVPSVRSMSKNTIRCRRPLCITMSAFLPSEVRSKGSTESIDHSLLLRLHSPRLCGALV